MEIITTDKDVLVIPKWIFEMFGGQIDHPTKPSQLKAQQDPDGDYIIGINVLDDPEWDYLGENPITNPSTQESRLLRDWLSIKKYKYLEEQA